MAKRRQRRAAPPSPAQAARRHEWRWALILVLAVIAAYLPVWRAGFIWDDDKVVTANPVMIGLGGLAKIWTSSAADICPLTLTTFWIEHALWGSAALPYHLVNVLLHAGCALLLWRVLRQLQIPGAWLGAALWALHPVQVESVAWITEMKNTESTLFYLLAILFFIQDLTAPSGRTYGLTLLFAALALAAKSSTLVLPFALLLCAWWIERRWSARSFFKIAPVFLMSLAAGLVAIWTQSSRGAADPYWSRTWPERLAAAGDSVWFYLGKLLWPQPLLTVYPRWRIDASAWSSWLPLLAVVIVFGVLWFPRNRWARPWFFAWSYFLAALLPVLGFANLAFFANSFVADHFQYLASMAPLALAGAGWKRAADLARPEKSPWPGIAAAALLAILALGAFHQATFYRSQETLWTHTLAFNPDSWTAHNNLATVLFRQGRVDDSMAEDRRGIALNPHDAEAWNNLGIAFARQGRFDDAIAALAQTAQVDPGYPDLRRNTAGIHNNYGLALLQAGRVDAAIAQHRIAARIDPDLPDIHNDLGNALLKKNDLAGAQAEYEKALALDPNYVEAHYDLGLVFAREGRLRESAAQFETALRLQPDLAPAQANLDQLRAALRQTGTAR
jgi:tetratricopeptide (TPR) repeat protein